MEKICRVLLEKICRDLLKTYVVFVENICSDFLTFSEYLKVLKTWVIIAT
jgi:hypothetical protein